MADTKDWTWVLERPCDECGLDASRVTRDEVPPRLVGSAQVLAGALDGPAAAVRPAPDVWSPLEYACHVRDVCRLYLERLELMLTQDDPLYPNWDQDASATGYAAEDPGAVAAELLAAAQVLADRFASLPAEAWDRTGSRSDGARFTVDSFSQYLVHDPAHHVWDVTGARQS